MSLSPLQLAELFTGLVKKHPVRTVHVAGDTLEPPELAFVVHFPILAIPIRGQYEVEIERDNEIAKIRARPGEAIFSPPDCWTKPTWRPPMEAIHLTFGKQHVGASRVVARRGADSAVNAEKLAVPRSFGGPAHKTLDAILELVRNHRRSPALSHLSNGLLYCIAHELRRSSTDTTSKSRRLFQNLCVFLQHNYHEPVTRDSVAARFRITPNHVSRIFKSEGNTRFTDYLTAVRIDRAKLLLRRYPFTVSEVAVRCGFADVGYFCRVFKRVTRQSPSGYRNTIPHTE